MNRSLMIRLCTALLGFSQFCHVSNIFSFENETLIDETSSSSAKSGIDLENFDNTVRAQDNFYEHVNGNWLKAVQIPPDKAKYGASTAAFDRIQKQLLELVDQAAKGTSPSADVDTQKIGDLYASFMDTGRLDREDLKPIAARLAEIDAISNKKDIAKLIADLNRRVAFVSSFGLQTDAPINVWIHQDNTQSSNYVADFQQGGIGLPERDYYLDEKDWKLKAIRESYRQHIEKMLRMAGDKNASGSARDVLALETAIARAQWDKVAMSDPAKLYNKRGVAALATLAPGFDWDAFIDESGLKGKVDTVILGQPSFVSGFAKLVQSTPLTTWKAYFRWRTLSTFAPNLSKRFVEEDFAFKGTVLRGVPQDRPRAERGIALIDAVVGQELGKLYVAKYFPPESKARAEKLVANILNAFKQDISRLDWMSPQTQQEAQRKLAKVDTKIGYPSKWRSYASLRIERDDLIGNISRSTEFEYQDALHHLGRPIDRTEWNMTPQTLDAYYNAEHNEVVFPAAFLQLPYFDPDADDAVNYGGIGVVIGHEISHGFDNGGSKYDGDGNLRDWWTEEDHKKFAAKTSMLVAEYSAFEPVPGYFVNGQVTLGENIADNSGLAVAYAAYRISLAGKSAPTIDGLTGDQRFYIGYAQTWRAKIRENALIEQLKGDSHPPPQYRLMGAIVNQPAFYAAFDIKEGDKMYRPPNQRVVIW